MAGVLLYLREEANRMVGFGNNRSFMADYLQVGQVEQAWTEHLKVKYSKEEAGCDDDVAGLGGSENQAKRSQVGYEQAQAEWL